MEQQVAIHSLVQFSIFRRRATSIRLLSSCGERIMPLSGSCFSISLFLTEFTGCFITSKSGVLLRRENNALEWFLLLHQSLLNRVHWVFHHFEERRPAGVPDKAGLAKSCLHIAGGHPGDPLGGEVANCQQACSCSRRHHLVPVGEEGLEAGTYHAACCADPLHHCVSVLLRLQPDLLKVKVLVFSLNLSPGNGLGLDALCVRLRPISISCSKVAFLIASC